MIFDRRAARTEAARKVAAVMAEPGDFDVLWDTDDGTVELVTRRGSRIVLDVALVVPARPLIHTLNFDALPEVGAFLAMPKGTRFRCGLTTHVLEIAMIGRLEEVSSQRGRAVAIRVTLDGEEGRGGWIARPKERRSRGRGRR